MVEIDPGAEASPDETTICKFRDLIEYKEIGNLIFASVIEHLKAQGFILGKGTIVDAMIMMGPSSNKNTSKERDPEMHQTKKGNQWYFGMKGHIRVDRKQKIIHSINVTPANVHDRQFVSELLHGGETKVWGDSAYRGQKAAIRKAAPKARDMTNKRGGEDTNL